MSNRWKIACLDVWEQDVQDATRAVAPDDFDLHFATSYDDAEQLGLAADSDFILAGWSPVPAAMIEGSPKVRMVHKWGIGFDKIDLEACRKAGIPVLITAGANKGPVAEHTIMLMLAVYRQLGRMDQGIRGGRWLKKEARSATRRLDGKTVGLLGFGNIGRMVAQKIRGFDVDLTYYDIQRADRETEKELGVRFVSYDDLLSSSDVLSLHVPLDDGTRAMINDESLSAMKDGAILINCARGEIIDADAVARALQSGKLLGAGIDVWPSEPATPDHPLLAFDTVVATPHTAGAVYDNVGHVSAHAFRNMRRLLDGQPLPSADVIVPAGE